MRHFIVLPQGFEQWVVGHARQLQLLIAILTVAAMCCIARVPIGASMLQAFMADLDQYQRYEERASLLDGDSADLLLVATRERDGVVQPGVLNAIRTVARELESFPDVERVECLPDALRRDAGRRLSVREIAARVVARRKLENGEVPIVGGRLKPNRYWPNDRRRQQSVNLEKLWETLQNDEFVNGKLISNDAMAHAMFIKVVPELEHDAGAQIALRGRIESTCRRAGLGSDGFFAAGVVITNGWCLAAMRDALLFIFPLGVVISVLVVYVLFHRLSVILLTMTIAVIAIVWSIGVTAFVFGQFTLLVAGVPLVVLVISTSDVVHLMSGYHAELRRGVEPGKAMARAIPEVGGACVLTSITTFVGFLSLVVIPAATIQHVAVALSVGTASALILTLTIMPMFLAHVRPFDLAAPTGMSAVASHAIAAVLTVCRNCSLHHPKKVAAACLVILVLCVFAGSGLRIDPDVPSRFPRSHPLRESIAFFNESFSGVSIIEVFFQTDSERLLSTDSMEALANVEDSVENLAGVKSVQSLMTVFRAVDHSLGGEGRRPLTQASGEAHLKFVESIDKEALRSVVARSSGLTRIAVQVTPTSLGELLNLSQRIDVISKLLVPSDMTVDTSGFYTVIAESVDEIVASEYRGFGICFTIVVIIMAVGFRSIAFALVAIVPNLLPLFALIGVISLMSPAMDSDLLMVMIVSLGLAIDDTTHFLHRYGIEMDRLQDAKQALETTYRYTGKAIVQTTLILSLGLFPFALCEYFSLRMLGTHLVFVLLFALLSDLLLLPAILLLVFRRGGGLNSVVPAVDCLGCRHPAPKDISSDKPSAT